MSLVVLGAILAFAVRGDLPGIDVQTVGLIFMLAGAAVVARARKGTRHEHVVTRVEEPAEDDASPRTYEESIVDRELR